MIGCASDRLSGFSGTRRPIVIATDCNGFAHTLFQPLRKQCHLHRMYVVVDQSQEIEVVYDSGDGICGGGSSDPLPVISYTTSAESENIADGAENCMADMSTGEMNISPRSLGSDGFHTPRSSCETPRSNNVDQNAVGDVGVATKGSMGDKERETPAEPAAPYEEHSSKEISRRLVEYFVVVSSVPKARKKKDAEKSPKQNSNKEYKRSLSKDSQSQQSSQVAARMDVRRAHLDRDFSGGSHNAATSTVGGSVDTLDDQSRAPLPAYKSPTIPTTTESVFDDPYYREYSMSSSGHEKDQRLGDECLEIGESVYSEKKSTAKTMKSNFLKSMNEQKKKIQASTAKMNASSGMQNLEKKLEGLKLEKTLSKLKSMKIKASVSSSMEEEGRGNEQRRNDEDDDDRSSSSDSSFSLDGVSPSDLTFRPSGNATSRSTTPAPISPTPPPPPVLSSPNVTPTQAPAGFSPLPVRDTTPRGATENIRLGHDSDACDREYNDDIDDCRLEPVITAQYPPKDHPDQPLNPMLPQFCHPQGSDGIVPLHEYKMPTVHYFVLTDAKGGKLYGTCLTVYEEFTVHSDDVEIASGEDDDRGNDHDVHSPKWSEGHERGFVELSVNGSPRAGRSRRRAKGHKYYAPRVLCLLSTWPYLTAFRTYLTQLYRLATTTNLMTAPLERYILNICSEVPAPPPGSFEVKISILESDIRFWAPPADQPIPYVSLPYGVLFECLDIGNVLFAWYTLACERKILLVSSQLSLLTVCAEILCSMLFPMRWSHLYIPW